MFTCCSSYPGFHRLARSSRESVNRWIWAWSIVGSGGARLVAPAPRVGSVRHMPTTSTPAPQVVRAGFAAIKGTRHRALPEVTLDARGPVGDRDWCLVNPSTGRVMRTVAMPLLQVVAHWDGRVLGVDLPDRRTVREEPVPTGPAVEVDYWRRRVEVVPHHGAVGRALAEVVDADVVLCRARRGDIVYGAAVTLVGTATLDDLADRTGEPRLAAESERFRSTFLVETSYPGEEDVWVGHEVRLGEALVRLTGRVGRCGIPDLAPTTGVRDLSVLRQLAAYRPTSAAGEPLLAVEGEVVTPGTVVVGAA